MYRGIPTAIELCASLGAGRISDRLRGEAYNVVIDVENPTKFDDHDNAVIKLVDSFLRERKHNPIATVSNTIFPQRCMKSTALPNSTESTIKSTTI